MRIVVLGDFHLDENEFDLTVKAMEDVKNCLPDLVVPLGDFGSADKIGGVEGLDQAYSFLKDLEIPIRPILGNHDLQRESGQGSQNKRTMQEALCQMYNLQEAYGVLEYDQFRLFFINTDPQPSDSCYQVQECFVSDEQYNWLVEALSARPGVPAVFFTHAPPAGCGLRTVPKTHVRATNAYLDQNHDPFRWLTLIQNHPEIVMWFSAHYHLSHIYPDSCTYEYGTSFFTTGVHGSATRDGIRQSRIIDIGDNEITVSTLDHGNRKRNEVEDWNFSGSLNQMVKNKEKHFLQKKIVINSRAEDSKISAARCISTCSIGEKNPLSNGILSVDAERCLIATEDGFLWEMLHSYNAVMGTLHWGKPLVGLVISDNCVWRAWDKKIVLSDIDDLQRFIRDTPMNHYQNEVECPFNIECITSRKAGGVWVASKNELIEIHSINKQGNPYNTVFTSYEDIKRIMSDEKGVWFLTDSGLLCYWEEKKKFKQVMYTDVIAWDVFEGEFSAIIDEDDGITIVYKGKEDSWKIPLNMIIRDEKNLQILCLGQGSVLVVVEGKVYLGNDSYTLIPLHTKGKNAISISRVPSEGNIRFALGLVSTENDERPQLQIWECNN